MEARELVRAKPDVLGGLRFPADVVVDLAALCARLADRAAERYPGCLETRYGCEVTELERDGDRVCRLRVAGGEYVTELNALRDPFGATVMLPRGLQASAQCICSVFPHPKAQSTARSSPPLRG